MEFVKAWLNGLSWAYVASRLAHMGFYYANRRSLRSLAFGVSSWSGHVPNPRRRPCGVMPMPGSTGRHAGIGYVPRQSRLKAPGALPTVRLNALLKAISER